MKLTRLESDYAWGACVGCKNTVKFDADGTLGVCPCCDMVYRCAGDRAERVGEVKFASDTPAPDDGGRIVFDRPQAGEWRIEDEQN